MNEIEKYPPNGEDGTIKSQVIIHLAELELIQDLFFNLIKEKLDAYTPALNSKMNIYNKKLYFLSIDHRYRAYFDENKEKEGAFFRFCAEPYKEMLKDYIKIYKWLVKADKRSLMKARKLLNKFTKSYSIKLDKAIPGDKYSFDQFNYDSFHNALSNMKVKQIKELLQK